MEERELPVGWSVAHLGDLATFEMGQAPPGAASNFSGMGEIFVKAGEFGPRHPVVREWTTKPLKYATNKDVLICVVGATAGKLNLGIDCAIGRSVAAIRPSMALDQLALYFQLLISVLSLRSSSTGSAQGVISKKMLADIPIALAPLNEQRRIAAKLDTTLAAVEACRQRLDGVAAILKRFRQAVLAAATSGELTREWREKRGIDRDWSEVQLGDHAQGFSYGTSAKSQSEGEIPVLRIGNIQAGEIDWQELVYTSDLAEIAKYMLDPGDVLFNRTNSPELVGKTAIYRGDQPAIYAGYLIRVRCSYSLDPEFLNLSLNSPRGRDYCWRVKSDGVSQSNINAKKLAAYQLKLPPIEEQQEIVRRAQQLFTLADQLEVRLNAARKMVDRLTPALLAKAFRGELVPQDPNDEPASVLLGRIRAARQAEAGAGKPSRRGRPKAAASPEPIDRTAAPAPSAPLPPDLLARLLQECGSLSERALLAASELQPGRFAEQLQLELQAGKIREELEEGQRVWAAAG